MHIMLEKSVWDHHFLLYTSHNTCSRSLRLTSHEQEQCLLFSSLLSRPLLIRIVYSTVQKQSMARSPRPGVSYMYKLRSKHQYFMLMLMLVQPPITSSSTSPPPHLMTNTTSSLPHPKQATLSPPSAPPFPNLFNLASRFLSHTPLTTSLTNSSPCLKFALASATTSSICSEL